MGSNNRKVSLELLRSTVLWVLDSVNRKVYVKVPRSSSFVWLKKYLGPNLENWGRFQNYKKISTKLKKCSLAKRLAIQSILDIFSSYFFCRQWYLVVLQDFGIKRGVIGSHWGIFSGCHLPKGALRGTLLIEEKKKLLNNNIEKVMNFENMYFMQNLAK